MAKETEQLVVSLEARIRDFERNFDRANRTATRNFDQIERRASVAADRMEKSMSTAGRGIGAGLSAVASGIAGLVGGLSIAALGEIVSRVGEIAKGVASIGDAAKMAGLSTKSFQELKFVAEQNRIGVDSLTDGLKELSLRADEFIKTGQGSAAEAFQRLGYSADELAKKLKDPEQLFLEIIGKLEKLDKAAQIRIADEVFGGTGGEKFVQLIDRGEAGLRSQIAAANDLGIVLNDDVIAKADEIDRKFNLISQTIGTNLKGAIVEFTSEMLTWKKSLDQINEASERKTMIAIAGKMKEVADAKEALAYLKLDNAQRPGDPTVEMNIERQTENLRAMEAELKALREILHPRKDKDDLITKAGDDAKKAKPPVNDLNNALGASGSSAANGANGLKSYADAIRALKEEVPELAKSLADLDAQTRINTAFRGALSKARTVQEVLDAYSLRDQATNAVRTRGAREAASGGMLDLISYAEGTQARGYNETLKNGKYTGGARNLVMMTLDQIDAMQTAMLQHPANTDNSSAVGRYQIVQKTLRGLRGKLGLSGSDYFDEAMQDRLAQELLRQRGNDPVGLRNEWEGLRNVDDATIRSAYDGTKMPPMDQNIVAKNDAMKQQAQTYQDIIAQSRAFIAEQGTEQQALGMTATAAAKLRYEQQMLAEAQRAGIQLSPQQRQEISQLADGMAQAEQATLQFATTQEQAQQASQFFAQTAGNALIGVISGTMDAKTALQQLAATIAQAALQAALLGEGPLAGILGGGKGGSGGGLLGMIFSGLAGAKNGGEIQAFAGGGRVRGPGGPRSDSILARLSDGEHVVNAKAANKNRALLEAINAGKTPTLPAVAIGGAGGAGRTVNTITNTFSPTIPITVQASGNKETDAALSEKLTRELDTLLENKMVEFTQNQQRPGNMMSKGRFI